MFGLSFWEIGLIMMVALLVLGPKRLPGLAKSVGKGLRELRKASTDLRSVIEEPLEEIRQPLEEMRSDLVDTVHRVGEEVEAEASGGSEEQQDERLRRVEATYRAAARGELDQPQDPSDDPPGSDDSPSDDPPGSDDSPSDGPPPAKT